MARKVYELFRTYRLACHVEADSKAEALQYGIDLGDGDTWCEKTVPNHSADPEDYGWSIKVVPYRKPTASTGTEPSIMDEERYCFKCGRSHDSEHCYTA